MDEVIALERRLAGRGDPELAELLDEAFVEVGRSGEIWSRAHAAEALAEPPDEAVEIVRPVVRPVGEDVALCVYETVSGGSRTLRSSLWQRRAEGWRLLFHQGTPAADGTR
jgi:ribonuclease HI